MTTTMQAAQISKPGGEWEVVERVIPEPRAGQVRVKVEACGICHSDVFVKEGLWPGLAYPRVPGHEIAGHIDAVGDNVAPGGQGSALASAGMADIVSYAHVPAWGLRHVRPSQGHRHRLRRRIRRIHVARAETLAAIPEALPAEEAGPLCVRA